MGGSVIKEFLVSLGIKIDKEGFKGISSALNGTSSQLNNVGNSVNGLQKNLNNLTNTGKKVAEGIQNIGKVFQTVVKGIANGIKMITNAISGIFGLIGGVIKATLSPFKKAIEGIKNGFKSIVNLAKEDLAFQTLARKMMLPLKVTRQMTIALETLGASIEDIHLNPELFENYKRLMEDSKTFEGNLDFKEQMKSMRNFLFEFARLRQYFRYGAYAIADGFLRAFGLPLKKVTDWLQNLNKNLIGNFSKISSTIQFWTKPIADFFGIMFKEGVKAFEGLGKETKGFIDSLIKMFTTAENPIAFVLAMLDDFNAWHEGEESYLAPFWEGLTNKIKEVYNDIKDKIESAIIFINKLWQKVQDFFTKSDGGFVKLLNSLDKIAQSLSKIAGLASGIGGIFNGWGDFIQYGISGKPEELPTENLLKETDKKFREKYKQIITPNEAEMIKKYYLLNLKNNSNIGITTAELGEMSEIKNYFTQKNNGTYGLDLLEQLHQNYGKELFNIEKQNIHNQSKNNFEQKLSKEYEQTIRKEIQNANSKYGTDVTYDDIKAILRVENGQLNPEAVNTNSGDYGLMQINAKAHGFIGKEDKLKDANYNLKYGINYYASLVSQFKGDKNKAFTAYNTGPGNINSTEGRNYLSKIKNTGYYHRNPFMPVGLEPVSSNVTPQYFTPFLQNQSNGVSCGQSSVAMTVNALTGKKLTDNDINSKYGFSLLQALNAETKNYGFSWQDSGNFDKSRWGEIEEKLQKGLPILMGMNGANFSPTGRGHIVALTSINGDKVTIADPNGGRERIVSRKDIENAKGYPQGQFMFTATSSDPNYNRPFTANPKTTKGSGYTIQQGMRNSAVIKNSLTGQSGNYGAGTMLNNIVNINGGINVNVKNANASAEEIGNAVKVAFEEKTKFIQTGRRVAQVRAC